ncbi:hypothetical protein GCM10011575_33660 [Microlunatus endophyticus]|uniref:Metallo-beta-lactamase domain-containing protein n=1 Tax=Microlunatus endophyticus TaxID=1716077 RepID=A0A917SEB1_9ACTN|nr:MBL fold metallo-hydrolase [Microlunatus endophyticus]GGL72652.1 hypothetical protein GCM10011575_33660 [Microlunatus endophyticus]
MSPGSAGLRWDVLNIGNLSRNRFWGEPDDHAVRRAWCTSTLVRTRDLTLVVDPGLPAEAMTQVLDQRAGLRPDDVDAVFVTHRHGDHRVGLDAFAGATWWMAGAELESWAEDAAQSASDPPDALLRARLQPAPDVLVSGVRVIATPGHTAGHSSVRLEADEGTVIIAGDAVMTRDFLIGREVFFNTVDREAARRCLDEIAATAVVVVPGHDNAFTVTAGA